MKLARAAAPARVIALVAPLVPAAETVFARWEIMKTACHAHRTVTASRAASPPIDTAVDLIQAALILAVPPVVILAPPLKSYLEPIAAEMEPAKPAQRRTTAALLTAPLQRLLRQLPPKHPRLQQEVL